jgi:hypothetical protein
MRLSKKIPENGLIPDHQPIPQPTQVLPSRQPATPLAEKTDAAIPQPKARRDIPDLEEKRRYRNNKRPDCKTIAKLTLKISRRSGAFLKIFTKRVSLPVMPESLIAIRNLFNRAKCCSGALPKRRVLILAEALSFVVLIGGIFLLVYPSGKNAPAARLSGATRRLPTTLTTEKNARLFETPLHWQLKTVPSSPVLWTMNCLITETLSSIYEQGRTRCRRGANDSSLA